MADDIAFTPGTGGTLRADLISGVYWVIDKMAWGADGTGTLVDTGASAMPIQDGGNSITVDGTVAFSNTTIAVTNAGTFPVQAAQSGTWTVGLSAAQTLATVTNVGTLGTITNVVHVDDNSSSLTVDDGGGSLTVDGTVAATQSGTWTVGLSAAQTLANVTTLGTITNVVHIDDNSGSITVDGTVAATQSGTWTVGLSAAQTLATVTTVGTVTTITNVVHVDDNSGSLTVDGTVTANLAPTTSGGCSMSSTLSSASSNTATSVKGSAGQLYGVYVSNTNTSPRWLKFYNTASTPTGGSGTPVLRLLIPGNTSGVAGAFEFSNGVAFSSGIGFTITGAVADNDTTAISANEVIVNVLYK